MPVISTAYDRFSSAVKFEEYPEHGVCREAIVLNDAAGTIVPGTVLGKVTATGKWKVSLAAATDGSQNPAGVYIADNYGIAQAMTIAANTDTNAVAMVRGYVIFRDAGLTYGTGHSSTTVKPAFAALVPPMFVETSV